MHDFDMKQVDKFKNIFYSIKKNQFKTNSNSINLL